MEDNIKLELTIDNVENLKLFSQIHKKDINQILNEALAKYFDDEQTKLLEKNLEKENAFTNLDYDEFWDGVDI